MLVEIIGSCPWRIDGQDPMMFISLDMLAAFDLPGRWAERRSTGRGGIKRKAISGLELLASRLL